jgi:hypothetical protein
VVGGTGEFAGASGLLHTHGYANLFTLEGGIDFGGQVCSGDARAGEQVPFNGSFGFEIVSVTPLDATHVAFEVDVDARANHVGNLRGPGFFILDVTDLTYFGQAAWAGSNGDEIFFTFEGQLIPGAPGILDNVETFTVVGGTGRWVGASGGGSAIGQSDAATLLPLAPAPFEGTISSPGSLKK